jgi:hypothetical protein
LSQKGPEKNGKTVLALTAVGSFGCGGQKFVWNGIGADRFKITQSVGGFELFECFGLFGFGAATEKQWTEGWKKRSGMPHEKKSV